MMVPCVEPRPDLHERGRSLRVPAVLVGARPLHAHRLGGQLGEERRVRRRVLVAVAPVAAGAVEILDADARHVHLQRGGQLAAQPVRCLRRGPDHGLAVLHVGHRAGRAHRAVGVDREVVGRGDRLRGARHRGLRIALVDRDVVLGHRGLAHVLPELRLLGQSRPRRPRGLEEPGPLHRRPLARGDDGQEAALANDPGAFDALDRRLVHALERGSHGGRPDHARVKHAGHAEVLHVGVGAGDLGGHVRPRHGLAHDRVVLRVLQRRIPVHLEVERLVADQLGVREPPVRLGPDEDDAVSDREVGRRQAELLHRHLDEGPASGGRRLAQLHAGDLHGETPPRRALVGRQRGVALDHLDPAEGHVELLGHHLRQRDTDAGADVHLAGIDGDRAVLVHGEEAVHLVEGHRLGLGESRGRQAERHHERPGPDQEFAAGRLEHRHVRPPFPSGSRHASPRRRCADASRSGTDCSGVPGGCRDRTGSSAGSRERRWSA